jgi:hypothetical protein
MTTVAHAGGFGWDEAIVLALPIVVLVLLQLAARRRRTEAESEGESDRNGGPADGPSRPSSS